MEENDHIVVIQFGIKCNHQKYFSFFSFGIQLKSRK